jgi:hypothetical protein
MRITGNLVEKVVSSVLIIYGFTLICKLIVIMNEIAIQITANADTLNLLYKLFAKSKYLR